ncbi:MAG: hypothetical protein KAJ51_00005, partial [Thermoplasmata archaeon]|nr:hypothetical protein [Thermoplasmata archaeon]
ENAGFLGGNGQSTVLFSDAGLAVIDDKAYRIGSDLDAALEYDESINDGLIFGIPVTSKRGLVIKDMADMASDYTSLIGTTNFPDVHFVDTDEDSKIKVGWSADDTPEITANRDLDLQLTGDVGFNLFRSSGVGENPEFRVYGDEGGTPTYTSLKVASSGNAHLLSTGNIEFYGQTVLIGIMSNKWIQMLDQRGIVYGTDSQGDFRTMWDDSAHASGSNEAMLMGISKSRGIIIGDQGLMNGNGGDAYDLTSLLTGRFDQASLMMLDDDRDSYLQFYHWGDDVPTIKTVKDLLINAPNVTIGATVADEVRPSFNILGDADSDGTTTSETFTIDLTGASDPTDATWDRTMTQAVAHRFFGDQGEYLQITQAKVDENMYLESDASQFFLRQNGNDAIALHASRQVREVFSDLSVVGAHFEFNPSDASTELTDANGRQGLMFISGEAAQTSTASLDAFRVNIDITSVGSGITGDGNNIANFARDGTSKWKVSIDGDMTTTAYNRSATTLHQDCFDIYVQAQDYADHWDITGLAS